MSSYKLARHTGVSPKLNENSVKSVNSWNLINHWSSIYRSSLSHVTYWHCGSILVSNARDGKFEPFYCDDQYFCHWISLNSEKTFGENWIVSERVTLALQNASLWWDHWMASRAEILTQMMSSSWTPRPGVSRFIFTMNRIFFEMHQIWNAGNKGLCNTQENKFSKKVSRWDRTGGLLYSSLILSSFSQLDKR